MQYKSNVK